MPEKKSRPDSLPSRTSRIETGHGTMYVTVTIQEGEPFEVFTFVSKADPCVKAWLEAISRCISVGLRYGVPHTEFVDQLKNLSCTPVTDPDRKQFVKSPPDGIAKILSDLNPKELDSA